MKIIKKGIFAAVVLTILLKVPVNAQDNLAEEYLNNVQSEEKGSVCIVLTDGKEGSTKQGVKFQCVKIADLVNGEYILEEIFQTTEIDLNEITNTEELNEAARILAENEFEEEKKATDSSGELVFSELEAGMYLLKPEYSEFYDVISPILVSVPMWDEVKGDMRYDVTVIPKHAPMTKSDVTDVVKTGDHTAIGVYIVTGILAIVIAGYVLIKKRRGI